MKHRGTYPYPTKPGLYPDIPGWRGGLLEVGRGVTHRKKVLMGSLRDYYRPDVFVVFYVYPYWWRSAYASTYDRRLLR